MISEKKESHLECCFAEKLFTPFFFALFFFKETTTKIYNFFEEKYDTVFRKKSFLRSLNCCYEKDRSFTYFGCPQLTLRLATGEQNTAVVLSAMNLTTAICAFINLFLVSSQELDIISHFLAQQL